VQLTFPREAEGRVPDFGVRDPSARDVATGAWRALDALRRALFATDATPGSKAEEP
jgi:hypothetical protein